MNTNNYNTRSSATSSDYPSGSTMGGRSTTGTGPTMGERIYDSAANTAANVRDYTKDTLHAGAQKARDAANYTSDVANRGMTGSSGYGAGDRGYTGEGYGTGDRGYNTGGVTGALTGDRQDTGGYGDRGDHNTGGGITGALTGDRQDTGSYGDRGHHNTGGGITGALTGDRQNTGSYGDRGYNNSGGGVTGALTGDRGNTGGYGDRGHQTGGYGTGGTYGTNTKPSVTEKIKEKTHQVTDKVKATAHHVADKMKGDTGNSTTGHGYGQSAAGTTTATGKHVPGQSDAMHAPGSVAHAS